MSAKTIFLELYYLTNYRRILLLSGLRKGINLLLLPFPLVLVGCIRTLGSIVKLKHYTVKSFFIKKYNLVSKSVFIVLFGIFNICTVFSQDREREIETVIDKVFAKSDFQGQLVLYNLNTNEPRDCYVCLLRNPFDNGCITEANDPVCEAENMTLERLGEFTSGYDFDEVTMLLQNRLSNIILALDVYPELDGLQQYIEEKFTEVRSILESGKINAETSPSGYIILVPMADRAFEKLDFDLEKVVVVYLGDRKPNLGSSSNLTVSLQITTVPDKATLSLYIENRESPKYSAVSNGTLEGIYKGKYFAIATREGYIPASSFPINLIDDSRRLIRCVFIPEGAVGKSLCWLE